MKAWRIFAVVGFFATVSPLQSARANDLIRSDAFFTLGAPQYKILSLPLLSFFDDIPHADRSKLSRFTLLAGKFTGDVAIATIGNLRIFFLIDLR